jgi:hypothetical protein
MKADTVVIFQVLSNLKYGADSYTAGTFFSGGLEEFGYLVTEGVLKMIPGAKTIDEAQEIVAKENEIAQEQAQKDASIAPENTWGPQPDEPKVEDTKDEVKTDIRKYKVVFPDGGIMIGDTQHVAGSVVELDSQSPEAQYFTAEGNIVEETEPSSATEQSNKLPEDAGNNL